MRFTIRSITVILVAMASAFLYVHSAPVPEQSDLERRVEGRVLTSMEQPAVRIEFEPALEYLGGQRFVLYDVADAEQHFFVEADNKKRIKRLYWVQFEGYLPNNSHTYDYSDQPLKIRHGGLEWLSYALARKASSEEARANSDGARFREFIRAKGYTLPDEQLGLRMVWLDKDKRNELMIIYLEDLKPTGFKSNDLQDSGKNHSKWKDIQNGLIERAKRGIKIATLK